MFKEILLNVVVDEPSLLDLAVQERKTYKEFIRNIKKEKFLLVPFP